jgi:hypothetical protein
MSGHWVMSNRELDRLQVLVRVSERRLRRLWTAYRQHGASGLVSRKRGRRSNRRLADALREDALALVRERYSDFGPTFAHEKLTEVHGLEVSVSTLRSWMTDIPRRPPQRCWPTGMKRQRRKAWAARHKVFVAAL